MIHIFARGGLSQGDLADVAGVLKRGGVGIVPTDTVYGLVGSASSVDAVERIYELKEREAGKPLPVLFDSLEAVEKLAWVTRHARPLAERFWPGALTLVLPSRPGGTLPMQDGKSIGVRIPASDTCVRIIRETGPLVGPSANVEGEPAPSSVAQVDARLLGSVDFVIDAGDCPGGVESTVVDVREGAAVLREGAIGAEQIIKAMRS